jgi:predicted PurR-regulated permease PerM
MRRRATSQAGAPRARRRPVRPAEGMAEVLRGPGGGRARLWWGVGFAVVGALLLWVLRPVFAVLAASAGIAYILDPVVDWCERRGMSRERGIGLVFSALLVGTLATVLLLVPAFAAQAEQMGQRIAPFFVDLDSRVEPALDFVEAKTGRRPPLDVARIQQDWPSFAAELWPRVQDKAAAAAKGLLTQGLGVVSAILNLTLMPIFIFYLLRDWDRMIAAMGELVPHRLRPRVGRLAREVDQRLGAFIRGQITVALAMAGLYTAGLLLVGIDLAVPVGVLSGALFIVPYLGTAVGVVLGVALALLKFGFTWHAPAVIGVFVAVQLLEGSVLTPRIVGDKVGLHPLVVMVALIVGAGLMGIWGMLLAIPVTAVLSCFAAEWLAMYRASAAFGRPEEP